MKKLIFIFTVLIIISQTNKLFSQWDQPLDSGYYYDDGNVRMIEYFKHYIEGKLDSTRLNDSAYIQQINQFVSSKGAIVKKIYYEPQIRGIDIILPDSLDALDMINVFMETGLFMKIYPVAPMRLNSNTEDLNDLYYNQQSHSR